jgi:hypothetical protein
MFGWLLAFGLWASALAPWSVEAQQAEAQEEAAEPAPEAGPTPEPTPAEAAPVVPKAASPPTQILVQGGEAVESGDVEMVQAGAGEAPEVRPQVVQLKEPPRDRLSQSADAGALRGLRVLGVQDGVARVALGDGSERTLRPGDSFAGDVVRSVAPRRILLDRRAGEGEGGGSATVVVKVGPDGRSQVFVLWTRDPRQKLLPQVNR